MYRNTRRSLRGFTLTELAIVLAVVGVLAAGLWNLLSGANEQVRDESAASTQRQLADSVKAYLNSTSGQQYMASNTNCGGACAANANFQLPLPLTNTSNANCRTSTNYTATGDANLLNFCDYVPPGMTSASVNSYRQTFNIRVMRDGTTAGQVPTTYSFMILATGAVIPDTNGARIAGLMGADGGFVYSAAVCSNAGNASTTACGAFGGWSVRTSAGAGNYGYTGASSGAIASRTYMSPQSNSFSFWLARQQIPGDTNYIFNTMTVPEYLGGHSLVMGNYTTGALADTSTNRSFYLGDYDTTIPTTGGGTINLQSGTINFGYHPFGDNGDMTSSGGKGRMNLDGGSIVGHGASEIRMTVDDSDSTPTLNPFITANNGCLMSAPEQPASCKYSVLASNVSVLGLLNANSLYAGTFIYDSSDIRLKKDISPIKNALEDVMRLKPVNFTFKSNNLSSMGVIAQDIEKIYPQLVSEGSEYKSVNYDGLIAPLIGAVQELKKQNDELHNQLREQSERQNKLEQELATRKPQ